MSNKIGISIGIDVTKIDKERLKKEKGKVWLNLTTFIDPDNPGKYGDHGFISQETSKDEREKGVQTPILGNCTVFFTEGSSTGASTAAPAVGNAEFDDDIPF
jgi:hypothetical protein